MFVVVFKGGLEKLINDSDDLIGFSQNAANRAHLDGGYLALALKR